MSNMPAAHPKEFRDDVVAVARRGDASIAEVVKGFRISKSCLRNWLKTANVEDEIRPGTTRKESDELRELKRRNRLLEQENEVLRRAAATPRLKSSAVPDDSAVVFRARLWSRLRVPMGASASHTLRTTCARSREPPR